MEIKLKRNIDLDFETLEVEKGKSIEEVCKSFKGEGIPYKVIVAKVDGNIRPLNYVLEEPCKLELLDIRTQVANLIYQNSLSMLYLCAAKKVLGNCEIIIENSLNKGLYTRVKYPAQVSLGTIGKIEREMKKMVKKDLPFTKITVSRDEAIKILEEDGLVQKRRLLNQLKSINLVDFYVLDGYRDFFYDVMVPSTSYIDKFQLVKCGKGIVVRFPHRSNPNVIPPYQHQRKLYKAFSEQLKWDNILGVDYVTDLNDKIEAGCQKELIQLSEALHEKKIAEIADMIKKSKKRIILIAGPSSSGKTTFAQRLCVQLKVNGLKPVYLGTDDYFVEREDTPLDEKGEKDFESLEAIDIKLFNDNMNALLSGKTVSLPTFDFLEGKKKFGQRIISITEDQPIVIEGIHGLNENLTPFIDAKEKFKIYIAPLTQLNIDAHNRIPTTEERMLRRMVRDNLYRGHDAKSTLSSWHKVRAGEDKNIFPYCEEADVFFNSYHIYEISVLRKYAEPLLLKIKKGEEEYAEAQRILRFLRFFKIIKEDSLIVNNSILREFIGGSIFVD